MAFVDVSIILVSYNASELIRNCLKSVYEKTTGINFDVWVTDNGSSDNTCEIIKKEFPNVNLIENKENKGFGSANNLAIKASEGKYVFLLNTDTKLINNAVKIFFDYMEEHSEAAACGGNLYDENNKHVHSYGYFPTFQTKLCKTFKLGLFMKKEREINKDKGNNEKNLLKEINYITGADLFLRRDVLNKTGLFDEDFFLYFEETELQYRIDKAGYKKYIIPDAKIYHLEGKSSKSRVTSRTHKMRSEILFYKKCYGEKNLSLFKIICIIPNLPRLFIHPLIISKTMSEIWKL